MTQTKRALHVTYRGQTTKVGFYEGTSDAAMERAIQRALGLADEVQLRFRDADGDIVALSAALPSGVQLAAELAPTGSPASTSSADSGTGAVIGKPAQSGEVSDATSTLPEVPGPRAWPFIGNAAALFAGENLEDSLAKVAAEYGRFVRLRLPNGNVFYVNSDADLVEELVNRPDDFRKTTPPPGTPLGRLRAGVGSSGLFTSGDEEEIWQVAHRILLPAFGLSAIKQYFGRIVEVSDDLMHNLASQCTWRAVFAVTELMTKMTFEAIGYAGFHSRFHCIRCHRATTVCASDG
jgi:cytochrome P450/NADPH-cytochrome P450 reductase